MKPSPFLAQEQVEKIYKRIRKRKADWNEIDLLAQDRKYWREKAAEWRTLLEFIWQADRDGFLKDSDPDPDVALRLDQARFDQQMEGAS